MLKRTVATILGFIAASIVIWAIQMLCQRLFPAPAGLDLRDAEAVKAFMGSLPFEARAIMLLAYDLGSIIGGIVATMAGGRDGAWPALVVGGLLTIANAINLLALPHPRWFAIVSTLCFVPLCWVGSRLVARSPAVAAAT